MEVTSEVLLGVLRLRFEEVSLEIVNRSGGKVFNNIIGYRVEELIDPRVKDRSGKYYTYISSS